MHNRLICLFLLLAIPCAQAHEAENDSFCKASTNAVAVPINKPVWWVIDGQQFLFTRGGETFAVTGAEMVFCADEGCATRHRVWMQKEFNLSQAAETLSGLQGEQQMRKLIQLAKKP